MPINNLTLRKALKLAFSEAAPRRSDIRAIIRADIARERGSEKGGGDFYSPFWSDAKQHALGLSDLHGDTVNRIQANPGRANLYPQLRDGFLLWWGQRRRWTNAPYEQGHNHFNQVLIPQIDMTIRVENLMSVIDGRGDEYVVYPYFFPDPNVTDAMARIGLWALSTTLSDVPPSKIRLLDVLRGQAFSLERNPLQGNEEEVFVAHLATILSEHEDLRLEY